MTVKDVCGYRTSRSCETARLRLKLLLVSDKAGCSPETIRMIRDDIVHVILKYMEIEKDKVQLLIQTDNLPKNSEGKLPVLEIHIPVRSISSKGLY